MNEPMTIEPGSLHPVIGASGHFAARLFAAPVAGQIGPQEHQHVVYAKSLTAAKRAAKALAEHNGWRLVEVFPLAPGERNEFRQGGWYVNTLMA